MLELNLALGAQGEAGERLIDGINLLLRALEHKQDELSRARCYAQLLAYVLAIHWRRFDWPVELRGNAP